jgi:two-component system, OmpR family, sensor histidine kinase KdpD
MRRFSAVCCLNIMHPLPKHATQGFSPNLIPAIGWRWIGAVLASLALIALATAIIVAVDIALAPRHLVFGYLVPTAVVAILFGRTPALLASLVSALAAAFFLYAPKFSIYITDPLHIAELALFSILAFTASQVIAGLAEDTRGGDRVGRRMG